MKRRYDYEAFRAAHACDCGAHGFVGLTFGKVALVSPEDLPAIAKTRWCAAYVNGHDKPPYASTSGSRNKVRMHRMIMGDPPRMEIDHINRDTLDNRRENLRAVTKSINSLNKLPTGSVPFRGVRMNRNRFRASVTVNGKAIILGNFSSAEEAARAYDAGVIKYHGPDATTNWSLGLFRPAAHAGGL